MCYHTKLSKDIRSIEERFNVTLDQSEHADSKKYYHGFTYPKTPVITNADDHHIHFYNWGLVPFWASDESIKKFNLNTKIETINERAGFKGLVNKRCLIIADGYYEWHWLDAKGKKRQKYLLTLPNDEVFVFGGLWSKWTNKKTGETQNTYTIMTTEANELVSEIHNSQKRMPVILSKENEKLWLNNEPMESFRHLHIDLKAIEVQH